MSMSSSRILIWENNLTRLAVLCLSLATAYGIFAGAIVAMYYDVVPNMGALADNLGSPQFILYLLAIGASLIHLPLALADVQQKFWTQAALRAFAFVGPVIVFIGTDGLVAHFLWWSPISDTGQFHILHHSLFASVPLTLGYALALRWLWHPATFRPTSAISRSVWVVCGFVLFALVMPILILMMGLDSPITFVVAALIILTALLVLSRLTP